MHTQNIFISILRELKIPFTDSFASQAYEEHPYKYTFYGLKSLCEKFGIETKGLLIYNKDRFVSLRNCACSGCDPARKTGFRQPISRELDASVEATPATFSTRKTVGKNGCNAYYSRKWAKSLFTGFKTIYPADKTCTFWLAGSS